MKCSKCGETVADTFKFCPNCGNKMERPSVSVDQDAGTVKGSMTGSILSQESLDKGIDSSTKQKVDTVEDGGAVVGAVVGGTDSNIHVGGEQRYGDTFQGDKVIGDQVTGDRITTGSISGSTVAIGRGASASSQQGLSGAEIARLFAPLTAAVQQAPSQNQQEAQEKLQALQEEVAKGEQADDSRMARLINNLARLAPSAVGAVVSVFASPALGAIAGPVTEFALDQIRGE